MPASGTCGPEPPARQPHRWGPARIGHEGLVGAQGAACALSLTGNPHGFRTSAAWLCWVGDTSGRWVPWRVGSLSALARRTL